MKRQLKILNLIDIPWHSGLCDYAIKQSEALEKAGNIIYFAAPFKSNAYFLANSKKYKTFLISDRKKILNPVEIYKLCKFIKKEKIDILNAHTGRMQTLSYLISLLCKDIKIIRTKSDARKIKKSFTYSKIKAIICGSEYIKKMYLNAGFKKIMLKTIYAPPPDQILKPFELKLPFKIGIVGRLDPVKGHINFISAALKVLKKNNNILFYISGKEANIKWKDIEKLIPQNFRSYFKYFGFVKNVFDLMGECHLGIISSISSEAVSRVALEWMNMARAVISSNVGSLPEFIDKDYLYPANNVDALASKIIENLDFEKLMKIGEKNKAKVDLKFSIDNFEKETNEIFQNI
ncbi:MAG: glycosyltransferase family 4 protein [Elusimicrobiota bacterium]